MLKFGLRWSGSTVWFSLTQLPMFVKAVEGLRQRGEKYTIHFRRD